MTARAEIIAIGSELLLGGRLDTNSLFLTEALVELGVEVRFKTAVGDDVDDIAAAVRVAARRAGVVVMTGGLGPTEDDQTRQAVARVTGRRLRRDTDALAALTRRLAEWGRKPGPAQVRQALLPAAASILKNPVGSAPGFALAWQGALLIVLPGVPAEARAMFDEAAGHVAAHLRSRRVRRATIESHSLQTFGLPEADVDARVAPLLPRRGGVRLCVLAAPLGVSVTLTRVGPPSRRTAWARTVERARDALGSFLYAEGAETMEGVVGRRLTERSLTLATAESCTGGLIGHRLTSVPGSSVYVDRGVIVYSNESKVALLGVPPEVIARHGAVSGETAARMAQGIRERSGVHIGLSVTGIAGPGGGTADKPVGLVFIGLDVADGTRRVAHVNEHRFHGSRETIKLRASQAALDLVRRWLNGLPLRP